MYLNSPLAPRDFVSPFGANLHVPQGFQSRYNVCDAYWLADHPDLEVRFESDLEKHECEKIRAEQKLNPLRSLPKPQHLTPNATLQLDGYSTRHPVIVVNPQGLLQEPNPEYYFDKKPVLNLIFDKDMMRKVVEEVLAAATADIDGNEDIDLNLLGQVPDVTDIENVTDDDLEALTKPDDSDETGDGPVASEVTESEPESGSAKEDATAGDDDQAQAEEPVIGEDEAPVVESKGKGRRRAGINDEDI